MKSWQSAVCLALSIYLMDGIKCNVRGKRLHNGLWYYTVSSKQYGT